MGEKLFSSEILFGRYTGTMDIKSQLEVETKFSVDTDIEAPDIAAIKFVQGSKSTEIHTMSAIYFDTEDLRLTRAKITLRHREGGNDPGWHLKLPAEGGRIEMHVPCETRGEIPAELLTPVRSLIRHHELVPVVQIDNDRFETQLLDGTGQTILELCDDHVTSWCFLTGGDHKVWREWETEVTAYAQEQGIADELLRSATQVLVRAGAKKSSIPSKLLSALGGAVDLAPMPSTIHDVDPSSPAGVVLQAVVRNRDKIVRFDPKVRRDEPDAVHQMRVATREMRSHLRTFDGIVIGEKPKALELKLKKLAQILGDVRDLEVIAERFDKLFTLEITGIVTDELKEHLRSKVKEDYEAAFQRAIRALDDDRYLELLDELDDFIAHPEFSEVATLPIPTDFDDKDDKSEKKKDKKRHKDAKNKSKKDKKKDSRPELPPALVLLRKHLDLAYEQMKQRHVQALESAFELDIPLVEREAGFHNMRKSAKKVRYAAEAIGDSAYLDTTKLYKACKELQEVLGEFQDSVTARERLHKYAEAAHRRGEDTFPYGVLFALEHQLGMKALSEYTDAFADVEKAYRKM
ncbi:CYTH and CHAD domain-containing protein [Corynebacterium felinum]